jgi:hypothetical protein
MKTNRNFNEADAAKVKESGGMEIKDFRDFAYCNGFSYSLSEVPIISFALRDDLYFGTDAGRDILDFVKTEMIDNENYDELVMVLHGNRSWAFKHAATFLVQTHKGKREVYLYDCKNSQKLSCKFTSANSEPHLLKVTVDEDIIDDCYNKWDIYAVEKRVVEEKEEVRLYERM